ncbi:unnamed protein product, partial [Rotaria sordida]
GEDIRDEKVKLLRSVAPIKIEDIVIGQYIGNKDSPDAEYQQVVLSINNERWDGAPFILRAGKALNEKKS